MYKTTPKHKLLFENAIIFLYLTIFKYFKAK